MPDVGEIHSQDSSEFTVLVEFDAFITDDLALERPDEDLILEMYVSDIKNHSLDLNQLVISAYWQVGYFDYTLY